VEHGLQQPDYEFVEQGHVQQGWESVEQGLQLTIQEHVEQVSKQTGGTSQSAGAAPARADLRTQI
jgi:hypothetical protein